MLNTTLLASWVQMAGWPLLVLLAVYVLLLTVVVGGIAIGAVQEVRRRLRWRRVRRELGRVNREAYEMYRSGR